MKKLLTFTLVFCAVIVVMAWVAMTLTWME